MGGLGVCLIVVSGIVRERQLARATGAGDRPGAQQLPEASSTRQPTGAPVVDDEMDDIEALLRRRGIT